MSKTKEGPNLLALEHEAIKQALRIRNLQEELNHAKSQLGLYENALLNIAKHSGLSWDEKGRRIQDPGHLAWTVLDKVKPPLWVEMREMPFNLVDVDHETGEVSVNKREVAKWKRALAKAKR